MEALKELLFSKVSGVENSMMYGLYQPPAHLYQKFVLGGLTYCDSSHITYNLNDYFYDIMYDMANNGDHPDDIYSCILHEISRGFPEGVLEVDESLNNIITNHLKKHERAEEVYLFYANAYLNGDEVEVVFCLLHLPTLIGDIGNPFISDTYHQSLEHVGGSSICVDKQEE